MNKKLLSIFLIVTFLCNFMTLFTLADGDDTLLHLEAECMLENDRKLGELVFTLQEGVTVDEISDELELLGLPNDFEDTDVYPYVVEEYSLYTLLVPETDIQDNLVKLLGCDLVSMVCPNWILQSTDVEDEIDEIDDIVSQEADAPLESYDPSTNTWVMEKMGVNQSWKAGFIGSTSVRIAVLDTGYSAHTDVSCVDMNLARNVVSLSSSATALADANGHGTFIIGQIGATLNGVGINGICKHITVVPIKISEDGNSTVNFVIAGIKYAESIGVDVINLSYSLPDGCDDRIMASTQFDGLIVWAAGNSNADIANSTDDKGKANDIENWIVVGASNSSDEKRSTSNFSSIYVDLFAPGSDIFGIANNGSGYTIKSGTSMAAPYVAAATAIIMSHATHLTPVEVKQLLLDNVTPVTSLNGLCVSGGRLSLIKAVNSLYSATRPVYSRGDANGSGSITSTDYLMIKRIVMGTYTANDNQLAGADANGDGSVNALDYMMVKRYVLKTYYFSPI